MNSKPWVVRKSPSVRRKCPSGWRKYSSLPILWGDEHVINGRKELGLLRENDWNSYYDIASEISNESHNKISTTSYEETNTKSPSTVLKRKCGTWFFTPELVREATSMTEGSWILKFEPNNIISKWFHIRSKTMKSNEIPSSSFEGNLQYLFLHKINENNYKKYWNLMSLKNWTKKYQIISK